MAFFSKILGKKKKVSCPYCFSEVRFDHLWFRCSGTPAPGRPRCGLSVDEVRQAYQDESPYRPAFPAEPGRKTMSAECPECHGRTGIRLCETCHSPLPREFDEDSTVFGLLGARSTGKTVMLSVLMKQLDLNGSVPERFGHTVVMHGYTGTGNSSVEKLRKNIDGMNTENGQLPPQTERAAGQPPQPVVFEWQRPVQTKFGGTGRSSTIFSFYDTAGEDLTNAADAVDLQYLGATNGVMFLVDPFSLPGNSQRMEDAETQNVKVSIDSVLATIVDRLRDNEGIYGKKRIKQPLAVVVTKIDAFLDDFPEGSAVRNASVGTDYFDEKESLDVSNHVKAQINQWGGGGLINLLDANFENVRYFAVSALGREPDYRTGTVDDKGILPHRIAEPLLWLLAQKGIIPTEEN